MGAGETDLHAERREQNRRTIIAFHDDEELFQVGITPRKRRQAYGQLVSLVTGQAQHLQLDSFRFVLRISGTEDPADVTTLLETPSYQHVQFYPLPDDIHASIIEMEETGGTGMGSVNLDVVLVSEDADPVEVNLEVTISAELSDGSRFGPTYIAQDRAVVDLPPI